MKKIFFVSHAKAKCGVYEFGKNVFAAISASKEYDFIKIECDSIKELRDHVDSQSPDAIIYNYHPSVMPWVATKITKGLYKNNIASISKIQIGIVHEITQEIADAATGYGNLLVTGPSQKKLNSLFHFYIAPDPTLLLKNPLVFKTGRLVPEYRNPNPPPLIPTIGSFGFGTPNKGFEKLVSQVVEEFQEASIRLNIPPADFGDQGGSNARKIADNCRAIVSNTGVDLNVSHEYFNDNELLDFLASNSLNAFLYEDKSGRGLSSAVDNALAVNRPLAVSNSPMFRHVFQSCPAVNIERSSLKEILHLNTRCLERLAENWDKENLRWDYERILNRVFVNLKSSQGRKKGIVKSILSKWRQLFSLPDRSFTWLRSTETISQDLLSETQQVEYVPVELNGKSLNRILDDEARSLYKPAIDLLHRLVPITMSKKIERANVQQAFVFDTVFRMARLLDSPKMLCVGSYEDTASMALRKIGYEIEEIDPMINYFLQEFFLKPSTPRNYYNIIFSTSVIEHDPNDKSFIECVENLLAPGGIAVITCDYKDGWKMGELKPDVDERLYTKHDLEKRLPSYLTRSELVDAPVWDCPNPDFNYLGKYQYTFATFVFRKKF